MSFYSTPEEFYRPTQVATPFWQNAPVPGWGINPYAAGPHRLAQSGLGDVNTTASVAGIVGGGVVLAAGIGIGAAIGGHEHRGLGALIGGGLAVIPALIVGTMAALMGAAGSAASNIASGAPPEFRPQGA